MVGNDESPISFEAEVSVLEDICKSLQGAAIARATYWGMKKELMRPGVHHNLDHLEVLIADGRSLHLGCYAFQEHEDWFNDNYKLSMLILQPDAPASTRLVRKRGVNVSNRAPWVDLMGVPVECAKVNWWITYGLVPAGPKPPEGASEEEILAWQYGPRKRSRGMSYPQDLELRFENGHTLYIVSGAQMENDDWFAYGEPPVNVVFDEGIAQRLHAGHHHSQVPK